MRKHDIGAGAAKEARVVEVASDYILVAVRTQADDLKMIGYRLDAFGALRTYRRLHRGQDQRARPRRDERGGSQGRTAVREQNGNLKLIAWDIGFNGGTPSSPGSAAPRRDPYRHSRYRMRATSTVCSPPCARRATR